MSLRRFDLNLLKTFDALWRERNVTRAAARLNVTQPAVSNALSRLRETFSDELFVRTPKGVEPTDRCAEIAADVHEALLSVERALSVEGEFDPTVSERTFRIAAADYMDMTILSDLIARLQRDAPGIDLRMRAEGRDRALELLDHGDVDLAVHGEGDAPKRLGREHLLDESFVFVARDPHPRVDGPPDLETFASLPHANFSQRGDPHSDVDDRLAGHGLRRRVALTSPHAAALADVVRRTDLVAAMPGRIAQLAVQRGGVQIHPMPIDLGGFSIDIFWNRRADSDPGVAWFRSILHELVAAVPPFSPHAPEPTVDA